MGVAVADLIPLSPNIVAVVDGREVEVRAADGVREPFVVVKGGAYAERRIFVGTAVYAVEVAGQDEEVLALSGHQLAAKVRGGLAFRVADADEGLHFFDRPGIQRCLVERGRDSV